MFVLTCRINVHHSVMSYLEYSNIQYYTTVDTATAREPTIYFTTLLLRLEKRDVEIEILARENIIGVVFGRT